MLAIISPAKSLDESSWTLDLDLTQPDFLPQSKKLVAALKQCSPDELSSLMGISEKLALLNAGRYSSWKTPFTPNNAKPSAFLFKGDVYEGLDIQSFTKPQLKSAQARLRILSGLYGLLRPLDLIQPYRLEMGCGFGIDTHDHLYDFWGDKLTQTLQIDLNEAGAKCLVNLASQEYAKALDLKRLAQPVVTPVFKDYKNGKYKIISFYAKKARGDMAAYICKVKPKKPADLVAFDGLGYEYCEAQSTELSPVFLRMP